MLYTYHDQLRKALAPGVQLAEFISKFLELPGGKLPVLRYAKAWYETIFRLGKEYPKPKFNIEHTQLGNQTFQIEESDILKLPFCNLVHFKKQGSDVPTQPKVLIVAPLSGHHATLLRDTVRSLLPENDVYITDWLDAKHIPIEDAMFDLAAYTRYVQDFIDILGPDVHVVSVCQPCVPVVAAIALNATNRYKRTTPLSLTLMAGPIDARLSPTKVNELAVNNDITWFENHVICKVPVGYPGAGRFVYPGFLQLTAFVAMNPDHHKKAYTDYYHNVAEANDDAINAHRRFYDDYNAVLDMPSEYYLETIEIVFQEFSLAVGNWKVGNRLVEPAKIKDMRLFTIEGENDDICGRGQTYAAHDLLTGTDPAYNQHYLAGGCGHYGVFSGSKWRTDICPRVNLFIKSAQQEYDLQQLQK